MNSCIAQPYPDTASLTNPTEEMQGLPPGWQVSNSEGSRSGPPKIEENGDDDSRSESGEDSLRQPNEGLDIQPDSPGWEDVDPGDDVENTTYKCLICEERFPDAGMMLDHCRSEHSFDFLEIRRMHGLDFYSTIRLVNYIRAAVKDGHAPDVPDLADPSVWAGEQFMKPVLDDDALLYTLDDLVDFGNDSAMDTSADG